MTLKVWRREPGADPISQKILGPVRLSTSQASEVIRAESNQAGDPILIPIRTFHGEIGVVLVPPHAKHEVRVNGKPIPPGMEAFGHGDQIQVGDYSYWVAMDGASQEKIYSPEEHGKDIFCFLTKARLSPGTSIFLCPGNAANPCGVIYKADSWKTAMTSSHRFCCPHCGYRPPEEEWRPPSEPMPSRLERLLQVVGARKEERHDS